MKIPFSLASCRCATWEFIFCSPAQIWTCEMDHIPGWCDHAICAMAVGQSMQSKNCILSNALRSTLFRVNIFKFEATDIYPLRGFQSLGLRMRLWGWENLKSDLAWKPVSSGFSSPTKIRIAGTLWPWLTGCDSIPTWYWKQRRGLEPRKSWPYPFSIIFSLLTFPSSTLFPKAFTNSWDQFFLGFQVNLIFYL